MYYMYYINIIIFSINILAITSKSIQNKLWAFTSIMIQKFHELIWIWKTNPTSIHVVVRIGYEATHVSNKVCKSLEYFSPIWGHSPSTILNMTPIRPWPSNACFWQHSSYTIQPIDLKIHTAYMKKKCPFYPVLNSIHQDETKFHESRGLFWQVLWFLSPTLAFRNPSSFPKTELTV